jgi:hypothetical protein
MQPRAACRRTRATQCLGAVAGLAPPLCRVGRRRRRIPAGRTTVASFPVARTVSWCCLRTKTSLPISILCRTSEIAAERRRPPPSAAVCCQPAARMCSAPPDRDPADQI